MDEKLKESGIMLEKITCVEDSVGDLKIIVNNLSQMTSVQDKYEFFV